MLVDTTSKKHPTMAGPILVHQQKNFAASNYFTSTLICFNKRFQQIQVFGIDGNKDLIEAIPHNFPFDTQLQCSLHVKRNIHSKLKEKCGITSFSKEFITDMFGRRIDDRYEECLVDASNGEDFQICLQTVKKQTWNSQELSY